MSERASGFEVDDPIMLKGFGLPANNRIAHPTFTTTFTERRHKKARSGRA